jgi:hypothetical protein
MGVLRLAYELGKDPSVIREQIEKERRYLLSQKDGGVPVV